MTCLYGMPACLANSPKLLALSPPFQALQGAMCPLFSLLLSNLSRCTVEDWRLKWGLTQLEGADEADVSEALHSPSEGVRLNALYHCAKLAMALQTSAHKHTRRRSSVRVEEGQRGGGQVQSSVCVCGSRGEAAQGQQFERPGGLSNVADSGGTVE